MSDPRKPGKGSMSTPGQGKRREPTTTPSESSSRAAQPGQRSLSSIQSPADSNLSTNLPHLSPPQRGAKVPIPRLRKDTEGPSTASSGASEGKHRVSHACEPCRQRKTKCSGERPVCKHCEDFKIQCVYEDGKRDRTKKEYGIMAARVTDYEELLLDLSGRVSEADQRLIREALANVRLTPNRDDSATPANSDKKVASDDPETRGQETGTEHQVNRVGSTESLDRVHEDFNRSPTSRATGFMGKNSEVAWMEQVRRQIDSDDDSEEEENDPQAKFGHGVDQMVDGFPEGSPEKALKSRPLSESSYHCDDIPLHIQEHIQPYQLPPKGAADALLACYLECVHPAFPILGKVTFVKQYRMFYDNPDLKTGPVWLAILNLVFAIAARYGRIVGADWKAFVDDDYTYFCRARLLGLDTNVVLAHPELQKIQVTGLTTFYLVATSQMTR
ncbi:MAG: hypothetical protein Q9181_006626 [Wetmoreana brouardii]